jgi:DNA-binding transcriptional LysR family regulator
MNRQQIELRHMRYFVALAESLHFGRAATRLHVAQPSLSQQISQLEVSLGATLLIRTTRSVQLTDAGQVFLNEARDILARVDRATVAARRTSAQEAGVLRIGVGYCMNQELIVDLVTAFTRRHPSYRVEVRTIAVTQQVVALRERQLDVGFVRQASPDMQLVQEVLIEEPLVAAVSVRHKLARRKSVDLAMLAADNFVLVAQDAVPVYYDIVVNACRDAGFIPNSPHEADHLRVILDLVGAANGVALVPASTANTRTRKVAYLTLQPPIPIIRTAICWRADDTSGALQDFLLLARASGWTRDRADTTGS